MVLEGPKRKVKLLFEMIPPKPLRACPTRHQSGLAAVTSYPCVVCDVVTELPLQGNQLAVFTDARDITEAELLPLIRETNFSEAALSIHGVPAVTFGSGSSYHRRRFHCRAPTARFRVRALR